jgi:hypothetical protein
MGRGQIDIEDVIRFGFEMGPTITPVSFSFASNKVIYEGASAQLLADMLQDSYGRDILIDSPAKEANKALDGLIIASLRAEPHENSLLKFLHGTYERYGAVIAFSDLAEEENLLREKLRDHLRLALKGVEDKKALKFFKNLNRQLRSRAFFFLAEMMSDRLSSLGSQEQYEALFHFEGSGQLATDLSRPKALFDSKLQSGRLWGTPGRETYKIAFDKAFLLHITHPTRARRVYVAEMMCRTWPLLSDQIAKDMGRVSPPFRVRLIDTLHGLSAPLPGHERESD